MIIMYDNNGEIEDRFENRRACCDIMGIPITILNRILKGKLEDYEGYTYKEVKLGYGYY